LGWSSVGSILTFLPRVSIHSMQGAILLYY